MCILACTIPKVTDKKTGKGAKSFACDCFSKSICPAGTGGTDHYLMTSMTRDSTTKMAAAIFVPSASLASKVLALDLLK